MGSNYEMFHVEVLPAVLTVLKDVNIPRIPSLKGRLNSRKVDITMEGWKRWESLQKN